MLGIQNTRFHKSGAYCKGMGSEFRFLTPTGRSDVAVYFCNPRNKGADIDRPWGLWTASLGETQGLVRNTVSKI